ncbi:MAG: hydroxymethylbilane synthase [Chitinivibrionales bacterium]|nr:hydroxymethylbilane synthase [Chitinivibrionales bacterium]
MNKLILGTRKSALARIQTAQVTALFSHCYPDLAIEEKLIVTKGDRILESSLSKIGDKGLFTREIEQCLLDGSIHCAVHSYKDLPTELPDGLCIAAVIERVPPEDVLVGKPGITLDSLPSGACIGTDSIRRKAQLAHHRPDLEIKSIRGNVDTRIRKLDEGLYDAIILARAGLLRLGLDKRLSSILDPSIWYHAVGQGAMAVEIREDNTVARSLTETLDHAPTRAATDAERSLLRELEGGCQVPLGVRTSINDGTLTLEGLVAGPEGTPFIEETESGPVHDAKKIGIAVARMLIARGADMILQEIQANRGQDR